MGFETSTRPIRYSNYSIEFAVFHNPYCVEAKAYRKINVDDYDTESTYIANAKFIGYQVELYDPTPEFIDSMTSQEFRSCYHGKKDAKLLCQSYPDFLDKLKETIKASNPDAYPGLTKMGLEVDTFYGEEVMPCENQED